MLEKMLARRDSMSFSQTSQVLDILQGLCLFAQYSEYFITSFYFALLSSYRFISWALESVIAIATTPS
jgi:hypothetical protein